MNAPQKHNWRHVKQMKKPTKARIQAVLSGISVQKVGVPRLVLSKDKGVYVARQYSENGVPHPLVEIVQNGNRETVVLWDKTEVYK